MKSFNCTECGLCCTKVGGIIQNLGEADPKIRAAYAEFPFKFDQEGVCEKYDPKTKHCTVYNDRPDICNVDKMYYKVYHKIYKTKASYYQDIEDTCLELQENEDTRTIRDGDAVLRRSE